jgi:Ran-binding protein 9/10
MLRPSTDSVSPETHSRSNANNDTEIRSAFLDGDIDSALRITEEHFPNVLKGSPQIVFRMKCRKWVELISKANDLRRDSNSQKSRRVSNGYSKSSAVADEFAQDMELDDQPREANGTSGKTPANDPTRNPQYDKLLAEAMEYGQVLQREYRDSPDAEQGEALLAIFSLVAYDNPKESVHGGLLDRKGRVAVAEELNSAILGKRYTLWVEYVVRC